VSNLFKELPLSKQLLNNIESLGYERQTPIQALSLPHILKGKDLIAKAKTGSGKTAAFGLGIVQRLNVRNYYIQSLVLCPTRELADQVSKAIRQFARTTHNIKVLTLCGGMPIGPQIGSLKHGAHIVVGTPGRINDLLRKNILDISRVDTFVLDEADRMLEMGFQDDLDKIVGFLPSKRQTLLFSATYQERIKELAERVSNQPEYVEAEEQHSQNTIAQQFLQAHKRDRDEITLKLLHEYQPQQAIIFCNTKRETTDLANYLQSKGWVALALHGDLEQGARDVTLVRFANTSATVLVATDVAARGLDVAGVDLVVNYQFSRDPEVHVHRIGRTGRAGEQGTAITLFDAREIERVEAITGVDNSDSYIIEAPNENALLVPSVRPTMLTLQVDGGKKQKLRPGDILGALTSNGGLRGDEVGKIDRYDFSTFVAIDRDAIKIALEKLQNGKIKGRQYRARVVRG